MKDMLSLSGLAKRMTIMQGVRACGKRGFGLIEILAGVGLLSITLLSMITYYLKVLEVSHETTSHIQSSFLLEEGIEGMKILRDTSWSAKIAPLSTTTTYYLYWTGTTWQTTTTPQVVENLFARSVTISDVTRDGSQNIASTGTYDPGTKKIVVAVSRPIRGDRYATDTVETYITNLFSN